MKRQLLHNDQGETLVEVMAAILIAALSVALLFTCVMASSEMEKMTQKTDEKHYNALSDADARKTVAPTPTPDPAVPEDPSHVTIKGYNDNTATPEIVVYGDGAEGLYSYKGVTTP